MSDQEKIDLKKGSEEKGKMAVKILDALVFKKIGIDYKLTTQQNYSYNSRYPDSDRRTPFNFNIRLDVDVDRMMEFSPTYEKGYENLMYEIEDRIEKALRYVNLQNYFGDVIFDYVNDTLAENELSKLQSKLVPQIHFNFPDVTEQQIMDSDLYFSLDKSESEQPYLRVEFRGDSIEQEGEDGMGSHIELVSCEQLYQIMSDLFERSPLSMSLESESYLCHG